jgi:hypothetical protein
VRIAKQGSAISRFAIIRRAHDRIAANHPNHVMPIHPALLDAGAM